MINLQGAEGAEWGGGGGGEGGRRLTLLTSVTCDVSYCSYAHMHIYEYLWSKFVFIIAISRYLAPRQPTGALFSNYRLHSTGNGQNNWRNWILFETQGLHLKPKCKSNYAVVFLKKNWQVREQLKAIHL